MIDNTVCGCEQGCRASGVARLRYRDEDGGVGLISSAADQLLESCNEALTHFAPGPIVRAGRKQIVPVEPARKRAAEVELLQDGTVGAVPC